MAGGIDWFRWHHGSVTDQKFPLVARRAGASVAEVIAVWACVLESASMNEIERGLLSGEPDFEAMDCALGLTDGKSCAIFEAMRQRSLLDEHLHVVAWPIRQPKRERHDESSTERSRAFRAKQSHATPCNATQHQETPRVEESRGDIQEEPNGSVSAKAPTAKLPPCPYEQIVELYHVNLPTLPSIRTMDGKRKAKIREFWGWVLTTNKSDGQRRAIGADQALTWIGQFFHRASQNDFITGRIERTGRHSNWQASIEYLCAENGRNQVIERTGATA